MSWAQEDQNVVAHLGLLRRLEARKHLRDAFALCIPDRAKTIPGKRCVSPCFRTQLTSSHRSRDIADNVAQRPARSAPNPLPPRPNVCHLWREPWSSVYIASPHLHFLKHIPKHAIRIGPRRRGSVCTVVAEKRRKVVEKRAARLILLVFRRIVVCKGRAGIGLEERIVFCPSAGVRENIVGVCYGLLRVSGESWTHSRIAQWPVVALAEWHRRAACLDACAATRACMPSESRPFQ